MTESVGEDETYAAMRVPFERAYPGQEPFHYGTLISWNLGGPDPLDGISIYWNPKGPHWHYVGFGLSELHEKRSKQLEISGWGFELTFRLAAPPELASDSTFLEGFGQRVLNSAAAAPQWPLVMLNTLGRYVWNNRRGFAPGHYIKLPDPVDPEHWLQHAAFVADSVSGSVTTPNGRLSYLQVVGITGPEYQVMMGDDYAALLEKLGSDNPDYVTVIGRPSRV